MDTKQRRQELFIVEHHLGKKARDDHAEVLTAVFNLLRTTKPPYYTNELWPNIDMVRNELIKNEAKKIKPAKVVSINSATTLKRRI